MICRTMAEQIQLWSIDRLIPYARNARTHSDAQVAEIAASVAAFGFLTPILVDADGVIIAGHGRVLASRKLGLERVPVIIVSHLSDPERRAYALADNKLALNAEWDADLLKVELTALAGARRTQTAMRRFVAYNQPEDVSLFFDPTPGIAAMIIATITVLVPAFQAARVQPSTVLRQE